MADNNFDFLKIKKCIFYSILNNNFILLKLELVNEFFSSTMDNNQSQIVEIRSFLKGLSLFSTILSPEFSKSYN